MSFVSCVIFDLQMDRVEADEVRSKINFDLKFSVIVLRKAGYK